MDYVVKNNIAVDVGGGCAECEINRKVTIGQCIGKCKVQSDYWT